VLNIPDYNLHFLLTTNDSKARFGTTNATTRFFGYSGQIGKPRRRHRTKN
jgi:hypothetical protein